MSRHSQFAILQSLVLSCLFSLGAIAQTPTPSPSQNARIVVEAHEAPKPPLFFSATSENTLRVGPDEITGEIKLKIHIVQGRPETLTLGLTGTSEVTDISGSNLRDWGVRQGTGEAAGKRFLDLRPVLQQGKPDPKDLDLTIRTRLKKPAIPGNVELVLLNPGDAVGFVSQVRVIPDAAIDFRVTQSGGLLPLNATATPHSDQQFYSTGPARLELALMQRGALSAEAELSGASLTGKIDETLETVSFRLKAEARSRTAGARLPILSGHAVFSDTAAADGWHIEPSRSGYDLVFERAGNYPLDLGIVAAVIKQGDTRKLDFQMPAGAVVPIVLEGLRDGITFDPGASVVPGQTPQGWRGFLPASGSATLAWKPTRRSGEGALFFSSSELTDIRVGAGLLRQNSRISFRILQGKLAAVRLRLDGPGEVLGVEGGNVVGWKLLPADKQRILEVQLSRPFENDGELTVRTQSALGAFPVRTEAVRITPEGTIRHAGFIRVANSGAVRLELTDVNSLMQLAPEQWPGAKPEEDTRQVFVYRFPAANYTYQILASQILPEIGVSQISLYELTETDRVLTADVELDIREAPIRDWSLTIPADYAVVSANGSDVTDFVAETEVKEGTRSLKILFGKPVDGRELVRLRLEKNQPAAAGAWELPSLRFPGAKTVRGYVGVVSTPGYRMTSGTVNKLVEVPLSFFPKQTTGLQQAYRIREPDWTAGLNIEALGQSLQADVFHLYSLKEGVVYASVLLNYFVIGAPSSEWRIEVPENAGNIDVVGQNVRRDWRREGNHIIVSLHQPVLGAATLLVTFEQPMSARGGVIKPGEVKPLGVQGERGFVQVVSPLQVKHEVRKAEGLLKLEPLELPAELRLMTSAPSLATYQYTGRPFSLEMGIEWYAPGETIDQVVDFAKLASRVSADGQIVTDARYFVKTRGRKALRMILPEGVKLWEAHAAGEVVNARADGEQTLIPLPPTTNPNEPIEVVLRLGQVAKSPGKPAISAPKMMVQTVISEWTLHADPQRLLVPKGGTIDLTQPPLTETGLEWISKHRSQVLALLGTALLAALLLRGRSGSLWGAGVFAALISVILAATLVGSALSQRRVNVNTVTYSGTVVPAGEAATVVVGNVQGWNAMVSGWGVLIGICGAALIGASLRKRTERIRLAAGAILLSLGLLAQRGGAALFFGTIAAYLVLFLLIPGLRLMLNALRDWRKGAAGAAATASILLVAALLTGVSPARAEQAPASELIPAQMLQSWKIQKDMVYGDIDLTVRGNVGDSFLLLRPPAVLTDFQGNGLRVTKALQDNQTLYFVVPERAGLLTGHAKFEMPAQDLSKGLPLPAGPAVVQKLTVDLDQPGWEFTSPMAVGITPTQGLAADHSGATLVLGPCGASVLNIRPKRRDLAAETSRYFAEVANLFVPGPGVVNGICRVTVRPAQGRVSELQFDVPKGFTVGEVQNGPIGEWRFDPEKRRLRVSVEPAQSETFKFDIETQLGTEALPVDLALEPLRIVGAAGELGMIGLAFGSDAQPENVRAGGLTAVNVQDFDLSLLPRNKEGQPLAVLQQVFRYGPEGGRVDLKVAPVAPEVRVATKQVFSIGDDRLLFSADLNVAITRAGVFKLSLIVPEGLEVEALTGPALSHWTEAKEDGQRVVTLHLNGRTMGNQNFSLTLTGTAPKAQEGWAVPRLQVREATRQTGEIHLVPEKGIRLRPTKRENVSQLDAHAAGAPQPGAIVFRILQENWNLELGIESLDAWVTAQALQEVTMREGQTLTRIGLRYRVENAAVKQLRVRLPGLTEEQARTVRATGSAVSDMVKVNGAADVWEIRFQRGIAGETDVVIEFQGEAAADQSKGAVQTPVFENSRQSTLYVALRASGRLEIEAGDPPRGWQRVDWNSVPVYLQNRTDRSVPALCFRVAEPEHPLAVTVRRHDVADALKLRVTAGELTSIFSPRGPFLTAADLKMEVMEKSTMRVRLPKGAQLFNTTVNGENVSAVRDGDAYLFHVTPSDESNHSAIVRIVYSVPEMHGGDVELLGPSLSVPLENVTWKIVVPPGYEMAGYHGALRLETIHAAGLFGVSEYQSMISRQHSMEAQKATDLLARANTLIQSGQQQAAGEALNRAAKAQALDEATNEDARVQLRNLKTQQAVLGLNTRRQKLYLYNKADAPKNDQLEQAANLNPLLQGKTEFDLQQVDQLLMGNTVEENSALKGIAGRLVDQQLAAEPVPSAIDVTIPERGKVVTFKRSLQVEGDKPLELRIDVRKTNQASGWFVLLAALGIGAISLATRGQLRG